MFFDFFGVKTFLGLKTGKYFQCARPLQGAPGAAMEKKNCSVCDEKTFFETATKNKVVNFFWFFLGQFFLTVGARNFSKCPDPSKNQQIAIFSKNSGETPPASSE